MHELATSSIAISKNTASSKEIKFQRSATLLACQPCYVHENSTLLCYNNLLGYYPFHQDALGIHTGDWPAYQHWYIQPAMKHLRRKRSRGSVFHLNWTLSSSTSQSCDKF
jgi:hypothetical protein